MTNDKELYEKINTMIYRLTFKEKIGVLYTLLYNIEDYLDYDNKSISEIIHLLDKDYIFH
jgi:hypothetical protein